MTKNLCPICYTELIKKDVTPCMICGGDEFELDHFSKHEYNEYELPFKQRLILCNFCDVDFSSFDPTYFGFKKKTRTGFGTFIFIKTVIDKNLRKDKYCPKCKYRLKFLKFVDKCRLENQKKDDV